MSLKLYDKNPWRLFYEADKDFENFWDFPMERKRQAFPACDFYEDTNHFLISFDLPGLKKEDIKINCENRLLTVSGARKKEYEKEDKQNHYRFTEKLYGSFNRSFTLPSSIDQDQIEAHFTDGVLELVLPKTQQSKGVEIPVQEGKRKLGFFSKSTKKAI